MKLSIQVIVGLIVGLLFFASVIAVYFALNRQYTVPLLLVAVINVEAVIFLVFLITRGVISPLKQIDAIVKKVGEGDFTARVKLVATKEVTEFANSVNEMIEKLQVAQAHEKEVEKLKTEFVSLAAHQLRTPLATIKWTLKAFLDGDMGIISSEQKEYLDKIYSSNEKLIGLINDLLNVTRIEEGRYLYQPAYAQLKDIIQLMLKGYEDELAHKNIQLQFDAPLEGLPEVLVDEEKIRLVIQNLVDNALRYTPGGGKVTVSMKRDTENMENMEVRVQDTGIGIPIESQHRVFEKFFRADNAKKIETQGSGLGLYLAKNIVEAHGGTIRFESQENKGTTFIFTIPIKPTEEVKQHTTLS